MISNNEVPLQSNLDEATQLRHEAINRYFSGQNPTQIAREFGKSRTWVYQVLARFREGGREGLMTQSRAPHRVHNRLDPEVEQAIVRIRQLITSGENPELRYAHIGADLIASELTRLGLPVPSTRTIERVLKRHNLTEARRPKEHKIPLPQDYPWPQVTLPNQVHLFDFVTRSVGGQRFYGCHLLDQARHWPYLGIITHKTSEAVVNCLVSVWQEMGLPQMLYMDNDVVWRGSSSGQRSFSRIVRICLLLGLEVAFTPPYTPKANPFIESFNDIWADNFWQRKRFDSLLHLRTETPLFQNYCRYRRPLKKFDGRTADQLFPDFEPVLLSPDFAQHQASKLPLTSGKVHFIRFVDDNGHITLLNERWSLKKQEWEGKTVRATIDTQQQKLDIFHQPLDSATPILVKTFKYPLAETVQPLVPNFERQHTSVWGASE